MKKIGIMVLVLCLVFSVAGYASDEKETVEEMIAHPINCATAEGDIRALEHEKAHVGKQIASGVMSIVPASMVIGIVTGTEKKRLSVATGDYNKMIDKRIADIKAQCGIE